MAKDHSELKDFYKESIDGWNDIYDEATKDIRFVYDIDNGQWPESISSQRAQAGRPMITSNKLQKVLRRIRGDAAQNAPRCKVIPVDNLADVQMAELYNGIIRKIEYLSDAAVAYDTAFNHALSGSFGFWRIITQYEGMESDNQEIRIERIINPLSVHGDPYAKKFSLEDAKYFFIEDLIDKDAYKKLYPKRDAIDFDNSKSESVFGDWMNGEKVRIAECFYKDPIKRKIATLDDGTVVLLDNKMTIAALYEMGQTVIRTRDVEDHIVRWAKMDGADILEENDWIGKDIPIIPMFGDEIVVGGKRYLISLARGAKGPQEMYNYWATAATETVALAPKMPFLVDYRQIEGFEPEWNEANEKNTMYIRYRDIPGLNKPSREPQAQIPTAIMSMMQSTAYDIEDHLGQYESSKGEASNERSRVAILARVEQSDKGTFLFINNRQRSIIAGGKQLIDLIPKVYDTQRAMQIMGETGEHELVDVNVPTGDGGIANDLSVGKYDLIATVGASFSSKRQEMQEMMIQSMQYAGPELAGIIAPLVFKYSDWPGAQEIAAELTKAIGQMQQAQVK